jgi:hypothetical protein
MTRVPTAFSMLFPCAGDSSSSKMMSEASFSSTRVRSSSIFPFPR